MLRGWQAMSGESTSCEPESMDSEDILFMLYTSGSTGKPKGITHSVAGYLLYAATTFKVKTSPPLFPPCSRLKGSVVGFFMRRSFSPFGDMNKERITLCFNL